MYDQNDAPNSPNRAGHSLGGSAVPVSANEIRQRRLAALERNISHTMATPPPPAAAVVPTPAPPPPTVVAMSSPPVVEQKMDTAALQDDEDADLQAALALSLIQDSDAQADDDDNMQAEPEDNNNNRAYQTSCLDYTDIPSFHSIMWDSVMTTDNDKLRWVGQGIETRQLDEEQPEVTRVRTPLQIVGSNHGPWGLVQAHGGPCGVLAAVQAELLRLLLFGWNQNRPDVLEYPTSIDTSSDDDKKPAAIVEEPQITDALIAKGLAMAIAIIIARAAVIGPSDTSDTNSNDSNQSSVQIVLPKCIRDGNSQEGLTWEDLEPWSSSSSSAAATLENNKLQIFTVSASEDTNRNAKRQKKSTAESRQDRIIQLALAVSDFLLHGSSQDDVKMNSSLLSPLDCFRRPGGVILLVMSLVASRGNDEIHRDMDDPSGTRLTSQFGHCSQELMNLLLTGQAVSNVFDNTLTPSGALTCRGVQYRPAVGYLSQLEAMRYCEVGGYYKSPTFPIWVVGSTSHFTVLFGDATCLVESKSDVLLETCRRAFKAVEGGEENGFIATGSLGQVLQSLDIKVEPNAVQTLAATLEVGGAGIILWDDFWKAASRLMTGATIQSVLQGDDGKSTVSDNDMPPLLITTGAGEDQGGGGGGVAAAFAAEALTKASQHSTKSVVESDEELARKLQAEWNNTGGGSDAATVSSSDAVSGRPSSPMDIDAVAAGGTMTDEEYASLLQAEYEPKGDSAHSAINVDAVPEVAGARAPPSTPQPQSMEFEQFGNTFSLFHYNGLRGGTLTPFCVTRLTAEEAVGHSIALSQSNHSSSGQPAGGSAGDLEDVIRTKWPSSHINWMGNSPPYID